MRNFIKVVASPFATKLEKYIVGLSALAGVILLIGHTISNGGI